MAPQFSWTGVYAGIQVGYAWGNSTYHAPSNNFKASLDPAGGFGGIYGGYNYQFPSNIMVGVEADINAGAIDGSANAPGLNTNIQHYTSKSDVFGSARIRLGYAIDRFLPFVTGGLAISDYKHDAQAPLPGHASWSDTYVGWAVGAGAEYALTDNIVARVEYLYSDYGSQSYTKKPAANNTTWLTHNVDLKTNNVLVGVSYKF